VWGGVHPLKSAVVFTFCALFSLAAAAADKGASTATASNAVPETSPVLSVPVTSAGALLPPTLATALPPVPLAAPAPAVVLVRPAREVEHKFLDLKNCFGLAAIAAGLTADALSTQKGLGLPGFHEMNPIARPFVQSRAGAAMYSAASFALMGGSMYLAHKTNHHKLERVLPFAIAGWETFLAVRNYHLISSSRTH